MKKILFAALAIFSMATSSCSKENTEVLVRFQNTTDQNINNARYDFGEEHITQLGDLPAGSMSDYKSFDYFQVGDAFPMGYIHGNLSDGDFSAYSGMWCGTGVTFSELERGKYTIKISKSGSEDWSFYQIEFAE